MAASIQFDSTELRNTTYVPRTIKHESAPEREIGSVKPAHEDGEVLVTERYGKKIISINGILVGSSQSDLESKIDAFKELLSRQEKNLDIDWNGSTRRYVASCQSHSFDRDHFHLLFVPWSAEFVVLTGAGKDTSSTTALNENVLTTTTPVTDSFTMGGSKIARPVITLKGANWPSTAKGVEYLNTDTGEKIVITRNKTWGNTDSVIIDCDLKKVTDNLSLSAYVEGIFYGVFPKFKIGTNNIKISVGSLVNQASSDDDASALGSSGNLTATNFRIVQPFSVPYADSTFSGVRICVDKTGTPSGTITWRIETDSNGRPSGSLADANATGTIASGSVSTTRAYIISNSSSLWALSANTRYHLVISAGATVDGSNYYSIYSSNGTYTRGYRMATFDGGSSYTDYSDYVAFRILYGGVAGSSSVKHSVVYTKQYL